MHNFNNINCRSLTVSCLSTRAATVMAPATGGVADSSKHGFASSRHGFAKHHTMYKLPKLHTHKIYHYPQQQLFTYRVTNRCLRTSQPQQQSATIAVTAAALQYSVSKYIRSLNSLFNPRKQYTVSNIFTYRFKSDNVRRLKRRRRTQCNTMPRECKTFSKLHYIL